MGTAGPDTQSGAWMPRGGDSKAMGWTQDAFDSAPSALARLDLEGCFLDANKTFTAVTGRDLGALRGCSQSGPLDGFQKLFGDDLIGVDVEPIQRRDETRERGESVHAQFIGSFVDCLICRSDDCRLATTSFNKSGNLNQHIL